MINESLIPIMLMKLMSIPLFYLVGLAIFKQFVLKDS